MYGNECAANFWMSASTILSTRDHAPQQGCTRVCKDDGSALKPNYQSHLDEERRRNDVRHVFGGQDALCDVRLPPALHCPWGRKHTFSIPTFKLTGCYLVLSICPI